MSTSTSIAQMLNNVPFREANKQKRENTTAHVPSSHLHSHSYSHSQSDYWPDLVHLCTPVSAPSAVYEDPRHLRSLRGTQVQVQHHRGNLHGDPCSRPRRRPRRAHQMHRTAPLYAVCRHRQHCVASCLALHRRQAVRYTALQHGDGASHAYRGMPLR
jgi:hypothetical protein